MCSWLRTGGGSHWLCRELQIGFIFVVGISFICTGVLHWKNSTWFLFAWVHIEAVLQNTVWLGFLVNQSNGSSWWALSGGCECIHKPYPFGIFFLLLALVPLLYTWINLFFLICMASIALETPELDGMVGLSWPAASGASLSAVQRGGNVCCTRMDAGFFCVTHFRGMPRCSFRALSDSTRKMTLVKQRY